MAFIYEVNGQRVQFDHEPTDADIDEAARGLGAKPESRMPKPVEGAGGAAFGVYRPAGRRPESQQDREASKDMAVQTVRGIASNVPALAGIPGSVVNAAANLPRTAQDLENRYQKAREAFTGQAPQEQPLPEYNQVTPYDMNYFAQLTPGPQPSGPAGQLAFGAGQMAGAPIVPPVFKAAAPYAKAAGSLVKDTAELAMHPIKTGKTAMEAFGRGYSGAVVPGTEGSSLMPIRETYVPEPQVKQFMAGEIPATSLTEVPTAPLTQQNVGTRFAYNMAPENIQGQKLVAPKGKAFEGYMENLGATYKQNPLMGALDVATGLGGMALTGLPTPVSALSKAVPALAARQLTKATQFEPGFGAAREAALMREGRAGLEANMPQTPALPAPGPVAPTLYANQAGEITGQGGTSVPQQLSSAGKAVPGTTPKEVSMNLAASKLQPVKPTPPTSPVQPADWASRSSGGYTPPTSGPVATTPAKTPTPKPAQQPAPKVEGIRSSQSIKNELGTISRQSDDLHELGLETGIKYGTPEGEAHQAQLGQLAARTKVLEKELEQSLKAEKSALKKSSKKGPSNVSQMLTEDTSGPKQYSSKEQFEKERMVSMLKEIPHEGSYPQGDKIIHVEAIKYGNLPKDITRDWEQTKMFATDKTGKRVPIGKEWTEADPEPLTSQLKRKLKRD